MTSIKFSKKGIDFNLVYKQGKSFVLTAENLYKDFAKETGNPVIISKICVHESETPLKNDGEDDIVDIVTYAMPDGTTEVKYFHNY